MEDRKELTGILSFNDRKTNDRQPDYRGAFLNQTKQKFSFSAWKNSFAPKAWKDTGSGVLFKNHNKDSEKHPDWIGRVNTASQVFYLSGWNHVSRQGHDYISISLRAWKDEFTSVPDECLGLACKEWVDKP